MFHGIYSHFKIRYNVYRDVQTPFVKPRKFKFAQVTLKRII